MLRIYQSNRLEALHERLSTVLSSPLSRVLEPELIVTQNQGMARWLALNLASDPRVGVAANLRFALPAGFVWEVFASQLEGVPRDSRYHRDGLTWRCMEALPRLLTLPEFAELQRYLADDSNGVKCYQLCRRIADVFDQYLVYRPDSILDWDAGAEQGWQACLWRTLTAVIGAPHRATLWQQFRLRQEEFGLDPERLPERVCVFGISALAPTYLEVFARLASVLDIHLFVLNPSLAYWGDIVSERDQARIRSLRKRHDRKSEAASFDIGNPLLASLGKQGREFQAQVHADAIGGCRLADEQRADIPCFAPPLRHQPGSDPRLDLLRTLQFDILMLQGRGGPNDPPRMPVERDDRSLQVHACHSRMREVEILHDQLLALFEGMPDGVPLDTREVVVMAPTIDDYAPCIQAVFGSAQESRHIPWAIADRNAGSEHPLIRLFLRLLGLRAGRFSASEVLSVLEVPAVLRRFGIDDEGFELIRRWIVDSGIRWGYDEFARTELGLPGRVENTWKRGLQSMLLGYAMADDAPAFKGLQPRGHIEGAEAEVLGKLKTFVDFLESTRHGLGSVRSAGDWCCFLSELVDTLFDPQTGDEPAMQLISKTLADFSECAAEAGFSVAINIDTVAEHLAEALAEPGRYQSFLTGGVTFCSMIPMRSIPFRVVCLLGMNESDYPRRRITPSFDLLSRGKPRLGDRSRRDDDRYLFLEALLSARDVFYISYVGRGIRDNAPLLPAGVVSELLDQVGKSFSTTQEGEGNELSPEALREQVLTEHRLQPFCADYFEPGSRLFSYASEWLSEPAANPEAVPAGIPFFSGPLSTVSKAELIELEDLVGFYRNPARFLLSRRLGLNLSENSEVLDDSEAFSLTGLAQYRVRDELLRYCLDRNVSAAELDTEMLVAALRERPELPTGPFADIAIREIGAGIQAVLQVMDGYQAAPIDALDEELRLSGYTLHVKLRGLTVAGLVDCRAGRIRGQDRLSAWIRHLALNLVAPRECACATRFVGLDKDKTLSFALRPLAAAHHLENLLSHFVRGQQSPLRFFPESSWAYAEARVGGASETAAMRAARAAWQHPMGLGEGRDPYLETAFRGSEALGAGFGELAVKVIAPALQAVESSADGK
jgi:exodeoxyribonuclease V gamma subunit